MTKIVLSIQNGLLAEAITQMLSDSAEFQPYRVLVEGKKDCVVNNCVMLSADILLAEVSYTSDTSFETRLKEIRQLRNKLPKCKIAMLCDENSAPDIAHEVTIAKKDGLIDGFFYSSVTAKYLTAALASL